MLDGAQLRPATLGAPQQQRGEREERGDRERLLERGRDGVAGEQTDDRRRDGCDGEQPDQPARAAHRCVLITRTQQPSDHAPQVRAEGGDDRDERAQVQGHVEGEATGLPAHEERHRLKMSRR